MNSKIIFDYISYLENENNDFKNKNDNLIASLNDLNDELNSLKKVSLMLNFNKQLKEKDTIITNLENEIRNIKNNLNKKIEIKSEADIKTKSEAVNEDKKKKKPKNCEIIKYKLTEYLLNNETNEIFELNDTKLLESIGKLKNGKVKFYNK